MNYGLTIVLYIFREFLYIAPLSLRWNGALNMTDVNFEQGMSTRGKADTLLIAFTCDYYNYVTGADSNMIYCHSLDRCGSL